MSGAEKPSKGDLVPKKAIGITKNTKRKGEVLEKKILELISRRNNGNSSVELEQNFDTGKLNSKEETSVAKSEAVQEEFDSKSNLLEQIKTVKGAESFVKAEISEDAECTILPEHRQETTKNDETIGNDEERVIKTEIVDGEETTNLNKECRTITQNEGILEGDGERVFESEIVENGEHVKSPAKRRAMTKNEGLSIPRQHRQPVIKSEISDNESDVEEVPLKKQKNLQTSNNTSSIGNVASIKSGKDPSHNTTIKTEVGDDPNSSTSSQETDGMKTSSTVVRVKSDPAESFSTFIATICPPGTFAFNNAYEPDEQLQKIVKFYEHCLREEEESHKETMKREIDSNLPKESPRRSRRKTSPREFELEEEARLKAIYSHDPDTSKLFENSGTTIKSEGSSSQSKLAKEVNSEPNDIYYQKMRQSSTGSWFQSKPEEREVKSDVIENGIKSELPTELSTSSQPIANIGEPTSRSRPAGSESKYEIVESPFDYEAWLLRMNNISKSL